MDQRPFGQAGKIPYFVGGWVGCSVKFMSRAARAGYIALKTDCAIRESVNQRGNCPYYSTFKEAMQER
jgi:hypothetical protein